MWTRPGESIDAREHKEVKGKQDAHKKNYNHYYKNNLWQHLIFSLGAGQNVTRWYKSSGVTIATDPP